MAEELENSTETAPVEKAPRPTRTRKIVSGFFVAIYLVLVWWVIEWRTAPPPPPKVEMPAPPAE